VLLTDCRRGNVVRWSARRVPGSRVDYSPVNFWKNGKKLLLPGTAVLYFAKVLRFRDVNSARRGVVMTWATMCREAVEVALELLVPE
jgi:hypothetical protein